ncbi:hypothetical protein EI94DRAFT_1848637 [Lactarius quietus]|nr:hypothetical protein EI94DRAFT_1848637 [Lactarius quietus]
MSHSHSLALSSLLSSPLLSSPTSLLSHPSSLACASSLLASSCLRTLPHILATPPLSHAARPIFHCCCNLTQTPSIISTESIRKVRSLKFQHIPGAKGHGNLAESTQLMGGRGTWEETWGGAQGGDWGMGHREETVGGGHREQTAGGTQGADGGGAQGGDGGEGVQGGDGGKGAGRRQGGRVQGGDWGRGAGRRQGGRVQGGDRGKGAGRRWGGHREETGGGEGRRLQGGTRRRLGGGRREETGGGAQGGDVRRGTGRRRGRGVQGGDVGEGCREETWERGAGRRRGRGVQGGDGGGGGSGGDRRGAGWRWRGGAGRRPGRMQGGDGGGAQGGDPFLLSHMAVFMAGKHIWLTRSLGGGSTNVDLITFHTHMADNTANTASSPNMTLCDAILVEHKDGGEADICAIPPQMLHGQVDHLYVLLVSWFVHVALVSNIRQESNTFYTCTFLPLPHTLIFVTNANAILVIFLGAYFVDLHRLVFACMLSYKDTKRAPLMEAHNDNPLLAAGQCSGLQSRTS